MAYTPPFPSLRFLQLKARDLKRRYAEGDAHAVKRVSKHWKGTLPPAEAFRLSDSYLVVARSLRCADWSALKRGVTLMQSIRDGSNPAPTDNEFRLLVLAGIRAFAKVTGVGDALITALDDPHARVRRTAAAAMALCTPTSSVFAALVNLLRTEPDAGTRKAALRSLGELARPLAAAGLAAVRTRLGPPIDRAESPGKPECWFYPAARIAGSEESGTPGAWLRVIAASHPNLSFHDDKVAV